MAGLATTRARYAPPELADSQICESSSTSLFPRARRATATWTVVRPQPQLAKIMKFGAPVLTPAGTAVLGIHEVAGWNETCGKGAAFDPAGAAFMQHPHGGVARDRNSCCHD